MNSSANRSQIASMAIGIAIFTISNTVFADPPMRVARLGYVAGAVSYSPAGENDWIDAPLNRPLTTGDRLWADQGAKDELQIGSAAIRMGSSTSVTLLNLDDRVAQVQLSQGSLNVHVRRIGPNDVFEIDTPNLAFSLHQPGDYRVDVDADGNATTVAVRRGQAEVDGEGVAYTVGASQSYRFAGTGLQDYQSLSLPPADDFDRWALERDSRVDNSPSARYVAPDMIGYEDLDNNGSWRADPVYGNVWVPAQTTSGWAPYYDGHWAWVDPWGWTWVDNSPWGFTVSHYGRWVYAGNSWGWVPGPVAAQPVYAPALVAFVGGSGFSVALAGGAAAGVAWFALGPQDVYRPSYHVGLNYFAGVNVVSTNVNHTNITNVYNTTNITNVTYVNRAVPGAVIAVSAAAFTQSQPVAKAAVKLTAAQIGATKVSTVASIAPVAASVRGAASAGHAPPSAVLARQVVVKTAPPAAPVPFAARQAALAANPGKPLDTAALAKIRPAASAPAPQVKLVHPAQAPAPMSKAPPSIAVSKLAPPAHPALPASGNNAKPAEAPGAARPPTAIPATPNSPNVGEKNNERAARTMPSETEPAPRPTAKTVPAAPPQQMPQRESAPVEKAVPPQREQAREQPHEPPHEPKPVAEPIVHAQPKPPVVEHAAPPPKPEQVKKEEPHPQKGGEKKAEDDKEHKE